MGFMNFLRSQIIDIVEWPEETPGVLVHRFERHDNEIKNGARMVVRPGQMAIFVNEGQVADILGPGTHRLTTANLPILTTLLSLPTGFESWHKAEVYFVRTTVQLDCRWGTPQPVMMRDRDFGVLRIRSFGNYSYRVGTRNHLLERLVGARSDFRCEEVEPQFETQIVSELSDSLGELQIPALDLASQYNEIGARMLKNLEARFGALGFEIVSFTVASINLPDEVNKAIDQRGALGALNGMMGAYSQKMAADAMMTAAQNESGNGAVFGMMAGGQLGGMMGQQMQMQPQVAPPPPPPPPQVVYHLAVNGQQQGPYNLQTLQQLALSRQLTPETLAWTAGMAAWQPAGTIPALQQIFASVPPAL